MDQEAARIARLLRLKAHASEMYLLLYRWRHEFEAPITVAEVDALFAKLDKGN